MRVHKHYVQTLHAVFGDEVTLDDVRDNGFIKDNSKNSKELMMSGKQSGEC